MTVTASPRAPRRRPASLNALDVECLRFISRFTYARGCHLAAWTGASPWTIRKRLRGLSDHRLATSSVLSVYLRDAGGKVHPAQAHVWRVTPRGADLAGDWAVPGHEGRLALPAGGGRSRLTSDHALGAADLAGWYRQVGFDVVSEREILSLERPTALPGRPSFAPVRFWSTTIPGRPGIHAPDLGVVHPDGGVWAIELERATKTVADYQAVIAAYRAAGLGQIWHIQSQATARRVMEACTRLGIIWGSSPARGVTASPDGLVRLQGWLPSRVVGPGGPANWPGTPASAPAGFSGLERVDLQASWAYGRVLDVQRGEGAEMLGGVLL